jgi:hypothetical protein
MNSTTLPFLGVASLAKLIAGLGAIREDSCKEEGSSATFGRFAAFGKAHRRRINPIPTLCLPWPFALP